jgi:hypothetical protein
MFGSISTAIELQTNIVAGGGEMVSPLADKYGCEVGAAIVNSTLPMLTRASLFEKFVTIRVLPRIIAGLFGIGAVAGDTLDTAKHPYAKHGLLG